MDSLITAAARALAAGDPLGALNRVALRDDPPALALRGIAMAQLGDLVRAKALLRSAARAFGPKEAVARARCVVAEAEIALVSRDLGWPAKALDAARATLEAHGDRVNAAYARHLDRFRDNDARVLSSVLYLNADWQADDGGALRLHLSDGPLDVTPTGGTLALFLSADVEHEVLPARRERLSVAGWFRRREMG